MSNLQHKIDFVALVSVTMANSNGDPLNGNRPRSDYEGYGEISDVCIKRKIRNRMQDLGQRIFVQSNDRCDDGYSCLKDRAGKVLGPRKSYKSKEQYTQKACETWLDTRAFGQVYAWEEGDSIAVRGPISIHHARSLSPVDVRSYKIVKSVNNKPGEKRGPDTMGDKHFVRFGLYKIKGAINVQLAEKTGFSEEDAQTVKECLRTLFENDASSARPEGSMEVVKLYWWEHNCPSGQYSSAKVHDLVHADLKPDVAVPSRVEDYDIRLDELPGLHCEIIDGL